jgi:hypothetical protein
MKQDTTLQKDGISVGEAGRDVRMPLWIKILSFVIPLLA